MPPRTTRLGVLLVIVASLTLAACGVAPEAVVPGPAGVEDQVLPGPTLPTIPDRSPPPADVLALGSPGPSSDPTATLCQQVETVQSRLAELAALELRPTAKVTLDIDLSRVQAGFSDMRQDILEARGLDLGDSVRRLGYRLDDLALAVEDFRTTSRWRDAVKHVEAEAAAFADALAGFHLQAGC